MSASTSNSERRLKLIVEYDGTGLVGWQRQPEGVSVQGLLEAAIESMVGRFITVSGASRTDAGVHARGQVASFVTDANIPDDGFRRGLNVALPYSVSVAELTTVPMEFSPRFDSCGKWYRYALFCRSSLAPMDRLYSWHRPRRLDLEAMRTAATALIGEHDFAAFRSSGCSAPTTLRTIHSIDFTEDGDRVLVDVRGNAFLRNMVRIIVGTLVNIGEGRFPADSITAMLTSKDRDRGGQTAPAHGLTLMQVRYGDGPRPRGKAPSAPPPGLR